MKRVLLHLSLIPNIGPAVVAKILRCISFDNLDQIYRWSVQDFMYKAGLNQQISELLIHGLFDTTFLDQELMLIEKHGIRWVTSAEDEYPVYLKNTHAPPIVLYWRGANLDLLDRSIALVGSRKANLYGKRVIEHLVADIVKAGWCLTSGGALGADTFVHQSAVRNKGITCAVIGSGLLRPYPQSNAQLFESIVANGGILMSPFPLTMEALPGNFPARNRIISGLSIATVVVQAAEKSGALITATYALEQGREVCAVPGHIDDPLSAGCHALLKEGALLVTSAQDIFSACGIQSALSDETQEFFLENSKIENKTKKCDDPLYLACARPQMFDDLCNLLGYDEIRLQERLVMLQLEGFLEQDAMGRWYSV